MAAPLSHPSIVSMVSRVLAARLTRRLWCWNVPYGARKHTNGQTLVCWQCNKPVPILLNTAMIYCPCERRVLLPPTCNNYFTILQCDTSFQLDVKQLQQRFRQLQSVLHPDRWVNKTDVSHQKHKNSHFSNSSHLSPLFSSLSSLMQLLIPLL